MRLRRTALLLGLGFGLFAAQNAFAGNPATFGAHTEYDAGTATNYVTTGDLNRDGIPDLVAANTASGDLTVRLGVGGGTFGAKTNYATAGARTIFVAIADVNGDGKPDLVAPARTGANPSISYVSVLYGNGDGTFQTQTQVATWSETGSRANSLVAADLNHDGRLDLAVVVGGTGAANYVAVLLQNADGTFQPKVDYDTTGSFSYHIATGDLNRDGNADLVVASGLSNNVSVLLGAGDGTFGAATTVSPGDGSDPTAVAVADMNRDGKPDLITADDSAPGYVSVMLGDGAGNFAAHQDYSTGSTDAFVAVGDINGDGIPDVAAAADSVSSVSVLLGNGDGSLQPRIDVPVGGAQNGLALADLNGDGALDIATANFATNNVSVVLQTNSANHLQVTTQPGSATAGSALTQQPVVEIDVLAGNPVTSGPDATANVTASMASGCGTLQGTTTVAAVGGVATFTDLEIDCAGAHTLTFQKSDTSGDGGTAALQVDSESFTISPAAASKLVITGSGTQTAGAAQQLGIAAEDAYGNTATGYTGSHNLVFSGAANAPNGTHPTVTNAEGTALSFGTATPITFTDGVATAGGSMKLYKAETANIVATEGSITTTGADRLMVTVSPADANHLTFTTSTANLASGSARILTAELRDAYQNKVTTGEHSVTFAKLSGAGTVTGLPATVSSASGVASRSVTGVLAGLITIKATSPGLTQGTTTFTIVPGAAHKLVFTSATTALQSSTSRTLTAVVEDAASNEVTSPNHTVTFAKTAGLGTVTFVGGATAISSAGIVSKTVTGIKAGSITIQASSTGLLSGTTAFTITPGTATKLVFTSPTTSLALGSSRTLTVEVRDAHDNKVASPVRTVTFAKFSGAGAVSGLGSASTIAGVASRSVKATVKGSITIHATSSGLSTATTTFTIT